MSTLGFICTIGTQQGKNSRSMWVFFIILVIFPISEILVFTNLCSRIGTFETVLLAITSTLAGIVFLRFQGLSILSSIQQNYNLNKFSVERISEKLYLVIAAFMLIMPGYISDALGILLLMPPMRFLLKYYLERRLALNTLKNKSQNKHTVRSDKNIIDGEYEDITET